MTRYFFDTQVIDRPGEPLVLLSIGLVDDDGRTYYAQNHRAKLGHLSAWQLEYVRPALEHLDCWARLWSHEGHTCLWRTPERIRDDILAFIGEDAWPEFWGDTCAFGFVVLRQLFGEDWPYEWPEYANDVEQVQELLGCWVLYPPAAPPHALEAAGRVQMIHRRMREHPLWVSDEPESS